MQFVCDRCKAKYDIDEARLRGKAVKIRCRGCGNILEVRDPNLPAGARPSLPLPSTGSSLPPPRGRERVATPIGTIRPPPRSAAAPSGRLGEKFQKAFEGRGVTPKGLPAPPADLLRSVAAGPAAPAAAPPAAPAAAPPAAVEPSSGESPEEATHIIANPFLGEAVKGTAQEEVGRKLARWHVAIRNQPMGPMSEEAIRRQIESGEVGVNSLVWREGFEEWRPLGQVRDLAYLAAIAAKASGGAQPWRESVFDVPQLARPVGAGSPSLVPPPPPLYRWLVHASVAIIAFALGMVFMYLVSGGGSSPAPAAGASSSTTVAGPGEELTTTEETVQTLRSGSLTIQLTNPTVVAEETINPPAAADGGTSPAGGAGSNGPRSTGRSDVSGRGADGGAGTTSYVPGRDLGPAGGQIRAGDGGTVAAGGSQARPLSAQQILPVVQAGEAGIQHCYDQARARDFVADLSLRLTIEIAPDGNVQKSTLTSDDYITGDLEGCILGRVRVWRFPAASATSRVVLPFAFHQR